MSLESALWYASRGLAVLPCRPRSKVPACPHGVSQASDDPEVIRRLWAEADMRYGPDLNVAVAPRRHWILDLDDAPKEGALPGPAAFATMGQRAGVTDWPATRTAMTPRGGLHLWWRGSLPPRVGLQVDGVPTGADVRGVGSYVLVPPSRVLVEKGEFQGEVRGYEWADELPIAVAPDWLTRWANPPRAELPPAPARDYTGRDHPYAVKALRGACEDILTSGPGDRHGRMRSKALHLGNLIAGGYLAEQGVEEVLVAAAVGAGKDEREARRTVRWGLANGKLRPATLKERG